MKWNMNDVKISRGSYDSLIAQFDGAGPWFSLGAIATVCTQKSEAKRVGDYLRAKRCEIKYAYDDDDLPTERNVISYRFSLDGVLKVADEASQMYTEYHRRFEDYLSPVEG